MLEPAGSVSNHCNVIVAQVVCKMEQGTLLVRVINVTDDALTLKEGVKVGMWHTDIEVGSRAEHLGAVETGGVSRLPWTADTLLVHLGLHQKALETPDLAAIWDLPHWNLSVFSLGDNDLGRTHLTLHQIDTGGEDQ